MTSLRLPAALLLLLGGPAAAESAAFRVVLGGSDLGALAIDAQGSGADAALSLEARFQDTPLGVADGTYAATSRPAATAEGEPVRQFLGQSAFSRGARTVSVLLDDGRALDATIEPEADRTELSDPALVPEGVLDPAQALALLVEAGGCPAPFRLYDGRRVVEVAVAPTAGAGGDATCEGRYAVVAGPGHLSPLGITSFALGLAYAGGALASVTVRTGPFELELLRE